MKTKKRIPRKLLNRVVRFVRRDPRRCLIIAGIVIGVIATANIIINFPKTKKVSPVTEVTEETADVPAKKEIQVRRRIPDGYAGIIAGVMVAEASSSPYHALGTSLEDVLVGQRTAEREAPSMDDVGRQVEESVNDIDKQSWELVEHTRMSDEDYETLLSIVEAESGGEDIKGRILVANVILNRTGSELFPDNVTDVVWQKSGGSPQFTPTVDGRIHSVEVSDTTREAVNRAIDGEDHSQGALFFLEKKHSEKKNVTWFDTSLKFLFQHGVHSFYNY